MTDKLRRWQQGWSGTKRIVIASRIESLFADESRAVISDAGLEIVQTTLHDEQGKLRDEVLGAEVLVSAGVPMDADIFRQLDRTRFLLRPYVGYDDLDIDAATEQGILVANVPDTFIEEVANHALALILAANRKLLPMDRFVRNGRWFEGEKAREVAAPMQRLSTMTLGLVGFGNIARLVAQRALPFGFRMLAADPYLDPETVAGTNVELVPLEQLLRESDVVSIHVFLSKETRGLMNAERLALMKPTAILVNTARGPVVDEAALIEALRSGRLAGAALDVMEVEPLDPGSPLCSFENVLLAPHLASFSDEGDALHRIRVGHLAVQGARGLPERKVVVNKTLYDELVELPAMAGVRKH
jgi:D-3-phosphoglycerate dehydrogenase